MERVNEILIQNPCPGPFNSFANEVDELANILALWNGLSGEHPHLKDNHHYMEIDVAHVDDADLEGFLKEVPNHLLSLFYFCLTTGFR